VPRGHVQLNLWHPADPAATAAQQAEAAAVEHYLAPLKASTANETRGRPTAPEVL
jgi:hypothetical protein